MIFLMIYLGGTFAYIMLIVTLFGESNPSDKELARLIVGIPFWFLVLPGAALWLLYKGACAYGRMVVEAEILPFTGPKELGSGQVSVVEAAGGEVSEVP